MEDIKVLPLMCENDVKSYTINFLEAMPVFGRILYFKFHYNFYILMVFFGKEPCEPLFSSSKHFSEINPLSNGLWFIFYYVK